MTTLISDFLSKECRNNNHSDCYGQWSGLGFQVICDCRCGHITKEKVLAEVQGPVANTKGNELPFQEVAQND